MTQGSHAFLFNQVQLIIPYLEPLSLRKLGFH